jgi:hypothetical protein
VIKIRNKAFTLTEQDFQHEPMHDKLILLTKKGSLDWYLQDEGQILNIPSQGLDLNPICPNVPPTQHGRSALLLPNMSSCLFRVSRIMLLSKQGMSMFPCNVLCFS